MAMRTDSSTVLTRLRAAMGGALRCAAASPWATLLARAAFALVAIVVLAGIGRAAGAHAGDAAGANAGGDGGVDAEAVEEAALAARAEREAGAGAAEPGVRANQGPTATPSSVSSAGVGAGARATPDAPVRLNLADEAELRRLPGVGPKRAQAILALRMRVGRFQRIEDLLRVKGVGRATLKKWRPLVTLDAAPRERSDRGDGDGGAA